MSEIQSKIQKALNFKKVLVVGLSPKPDRPSYEIAQYLIEHGYEVSGLNPTAKTARILDRHVYSSLDQIKETLEVVDVFRASEFIPELVEQMIPRKPQVIWLQLGITNPEAEKKAEDAGIIVISNRCILVEHRHLHLNGPHETLR